MADQHDNVRPLWKDADPPPRRPALGSVRTWKVAAAPHNHVTVTGRRGPYPSLLLTTGHVHVESLDHAQAHLLLQALHEAITWTWPAE